jgi:hypothetical protein
VVEALETIALPQRSNSNEGSAATGGRLSHDGAYTLRRAQSIGLSPATAACLYRVDIVFLVILISWLRSNKRLFFSFYQ